MQVREERPVRSCNVDDKRLRKEDGRAGRTDACPVRHRRRSRPGAGSPAAAPAADLRKAGHSIPIHGPMTCGVALTRRADVATLNGGVKRMAVPGRLVLHQSDQSP